MNYFAHGRTFIDDPYFLAGTAVPDWLCVVDRRVRARSKPASDLIRDSDLRVAAVARAVVVDLEACRRERFGKFRAHAIGVCGHS